MYLNSEFMKTKTDVHKKTPLFIEVAGIRLLLAKQVTEKHKNSYQFLHRDLDNCIYFVTNC